MIAKVGTILCGILLMAGVALGGTIKETYGVRMRDGLRIGVSIERPDADGAHYAIFSKSYGDGSWAGSPSSEGPINVSHTSTRRTFINICSRERPGGTRFLSDVNDIADIFTWLKTKSWFNGRVGMRGGSYGGATQWLATRARDPILKVIVPEVISPDMWKTCYRQNGALVLAMTAPGRGVNIGTFPKYTPLWTLSLLDMGGNQLWVDYVTNWTFTDYWKQIWLIRIKRIVAQEVEVYWRKLWCTNGLPEPLPSSP